MNLDNILVDDPLRPILQTTFLNIFSWMEIIVQCGAVITQFYKKYSQKTPHSIVSNGPIYNNLTSV